MLATSTCAHYINNSLKENIHKRTALYIINNRSESMQVRVTRFMNDEFIDHAKLTFKAQVGLSDWYYGSALTEEELLELQKQHEVIDESICKTFVFSTLEKSLINVLTFIAENKEWFVKQFSSYENQLKDAIESLQFIKNSTDVSIDNKPAYQLLDDLRELNIA